MSPRFLPEAEAEHLDQIAWYESQRAGLGARYLDDVVDGLAIISEGPHRQPQVAGSDLHRLLLKRFPFSIYYAIREGDVLVVAIAPHRRRPGYWMPRI